MRGALAALLVLGTSACGQILGIGAFEVRGDGGATSDANDGGTGDGGHQLAPTTYIKASNTNASDNFGNALAISADDSTLLVTAYHESSAAKGINGNQADNTATQAGAAYVFVRSGGTWAQQAYLKASNTDASDFFGTSGAISADGNTIVIGAYGEDSGSKGVNGVQTDNTILGAGAAYVFVRTGTTWTQQAYLKASNTEASDDFGYNVSISGDGNTVAVGAIGEDSAATGINGNQALNTALSSGAVYVFTRSGTTWTQQAYVKASNTAASDEFGFTTALSNDGNTLAVGGVLEDGAATGINGNQGTKTAVNAGAVYVYTRAGTTWTQQAYVKASNTGAGDEFGYTVALSADGNTLAVGAPLEDSAATGIDGLQTDNPSTLDSGASYLFTRSGTTWTQAAYIKQSNTEAGDNLGTRVALSPDGSTFAVSALLEDSAAIGIGGDQADNTTMDSGACYVFHLGGGTWAQSAYVKATNTEAGDHFGVPTLSASTLVVSAALEDSAAGGINGSQTDNTAVDAGAVYVYQ